MGVDSVGLGLGLGPHRDEPHAKSHGMALARRPGGRPKRPHGGGEGRSISFPFSGSPLPVSSPGSFKHHDGSGNTIRETGDGRRET